MSIIGVAPMLNVPDVQVTVDWYKAVGFEVRATNLDWGLGPMIWAEIGHGEAVFMVSPGDICQGITMCFRVSDVDELYEQIGTHAAAAPVGQSYGQRNFEIVDINGISLVFGQAIG